MKAGGNKFLVYGREHVLIALSLYGNQLLQNQEEKSRAFAIKKFLSKISTFEQNSLIHILSVVGLLSLNS